MASLVKYTKPETFRRFSPPLLAELLARYPVLLSARGIVLPESPDAESMPYKKITELFLSIDEVAEQNSDLYGTIHLVGRLANEAGRGAIVELADQRDVVILKPVGIITPNPYLIPKVVEVGSADITPFIFLIGHRLSMER